jgi:hypothetical protein
VGLAEARAAAGLRAALEGWALAARGWSAARGPGGAPVLLDWGAGARAKRLGDAWRAWASAGAPPASARGAAPAPVTASQSKPPLALALPRELGGAPAPAHLRSKLSAAERLVVPRESLGAVAGAARVPGAAAARAARAGEGRPEWLRSQALALRETPRIDEDEGGEAA